MPFYIYNNWTRDRGRIHKAECGRCNFGKGVHETDSGRNSEWIGPIEDRDLAFKKAAALGRAEMRACMTCNP
jgi:hypothetical protein